MKIIDVTVTLRADMPTWPGEPGPEIAPDSRIADGQPANVSVLRLGDHTGTHVDPPLHMLQGGDGVDALPLDAMLGPCRVLRYDGDADISGPWIAAQRLDRAVRRVLFRTKNSALWQDPARPFEKDFVALDTSAAELLVSMGIVLVGIDYLSIEPFGSSATGYPVHKAFLRNGVVIVEGLDLRAVEAGDHEIACLPLKILNGDGAPARVVLVRR